MKTTKKLAIFAALLICSCTSHAITNTAIAVAGTNIVLSWPSFGYEIYLVQYRQTLDPSDSWSCLTNAYPANSTNRTTLTIFGAVPAASRNGGSFAVLTAHGNRYNSMTMTTGPLAIPVDGSGGAVPAVIYPPGFDFSGFTIFDPSNGESVSGANYANSPLSQQTQLSQDAPQPLGGLQPLDGGSGDPLAPTTGFFEVFHIPNWLADFSGYTFDGPTFIPVDYAAPDASTNYVESSTVLINGQPTDDSVFMSYNIGGATYWGMGIYFDLLPNGTNTIQLLTTVRQSDTLNDQTPYMVFSNAPAAITIGNLITFTNWADLILSNTYTFQAQSSVPNVNWEIDIYDVNGDFVNYQTGYSGDGNIAWTWNLTDYNGNSRSDDSDPFFYPYITITEGSEDSKQSGGVHPDAGGGSTTSPMPPLASQFPSQGSWVFAYLDKFYDDGTSKYAGADSYYLNGIHTMEGGPIEWSLGTWDYPIEFGGSYSQANRNASWQTLEQTYLERWTVRNFYYFGHGAANSIGGDINTLDSSNNITSSKTLPGSTAYMTSQFVHDNITFNKSYGAIPFRFVFLDGCNTASGGWPQAWGIPKQNEPLSYYTSSSNTTGARPSAFVGWDVEIGGSKDWGTIPNFWQFRMDWMAEWAGTFEEDLYDALQAGNDFSSWVSPSQFNAHNKVYGYQQLEFLQYNYGGDWP